MTAIAILIANANYAKQERLECCSQDLAAIRALVEATSRFDTIHIVQDADADAMREAIRSALNNVVQTEEIFFYFSGHGSQVGSEFYFCGTGFDPNRPNETGLSHTELQNALRVVEPELLVKIVDACFSGTLLVKADGSFLPSRKDGFRNIIQLSSSLDAQNSFAGDPLSQFTRAFCEACLRREEGPVYYGDVINTLRDDFLGNDLQTPHFVSQGTGRELLVDDAAKLVLFRKAYEERWERSHSIENNLDDRATGTYVTTNAPPSALQLLMSAEQKMVTPEHASLFINRLFDGVLTRFGGSEFALFFDASSIEHSSFPEPSTREFIIRILSKENRPDNFVTAAIIRKARKQNAWAALTASFLEPSDYDETWSLELNCKLERAQLRFTLTPRYRALQRLVLVLTCAPSLERCYVFELVTQHPRTDWDEFDRVGHELVRRWYKMDWSKKLDELIETICVALEDAVRKHIENTTERLAKD